MMAVDEQEAVEKFKRFTLLKLDGVTCASHNKAPVVAFRGSTLRDIQISMRCCCGSLSVLANQAIARPANDSF